MEQPSEIMACHRHARAGGNDGREEAEGIRGM